MPGVPLDGDIPAPDPNASYPMPPNEGKVKGGFFRNLMGTKRYEEEQQRQNHAEWVMNTLKDLSTGVSQAPDSIVKLLVREAGSTFGPEFGQRLKEHFDQVNAEKALNAKRALLTQAPKPMGMPAMPGQAAAAPAAAPEQGPNFTPARAAAPSAPPPEVSAIVQRLMPLMQPQQQQQQQPQQQPPPGMPPLPNSGGAEAGPAPSQNVPPVNQAEKERTAASVGGGAGFGVPPPAPAQPQLPAPSEGNIFRMGPAQRGVDLAATALPTERQHNALALEHAGAISRQSTELQIAEAQRRINVLRSSPGWGMLSNAQQIEATKQALGIPGSLSATRPPINLPRSQIHGPEIPEGALGIDGRPVDRNAGKWYQQQQDVATGDIRYYPISPTVTTKSLVTTAGPVLVSVDRAGNVIKAISEIDKHEIVDPRLLETIRTSMMPTPVATKDEEGNPVITWEMKEGGTASKKNFPGQTRGVAAPAGGVSAPGGVPQRGGTPQGGGAAPAAPQAGGAAPSGLRAGKLPPTRPKQDPAATYTTVQYARNTQRVFPTIDKLIADLESTGDLGTIAGRWNEFKAGRIGAGDERYTALRTHMGLLNTALTVMHKTKGAEMMKHFQDLADAGKMNPETFKSAYNALKQWVGDYATMGAGAPGAVPVGGGTATPPPNQMTPPPVKQSVQEYLKSIGH